jgi:hypothetical protein
MWGLLQTLDFKDWLDIGVIVTGFVFSTVMIKMRSIFITKRAFSVWLKTHMAEHEKIITRLGEGDDEFATIKAALDRLATAEQLSEVRTNVMRVQGEFATLEERIEGHHQVNLRTERMVNTLHSYLLQQTGAG